MTNGSLTDLQQDAMRPFANLAPAQQGAPGEGFERCCRQRASPHGDGSTRSAHDWLRYTGCRVNDDTPQATATITITRTDDRDIKDRQVIMSIDGQHVATLLYGQSATRTIAAGEHTLRANNTLVWKTVTFDVPAGGHARFSILNRAVRGTEWMIALLGVCPIAVTVTREDGPLLGTPRPESTD